MSFLKRPIVRGFLVAVVGAALVGLLPLFGGPGYEFALAMGILLPSIIAVSVALELRSEDASLLVRLERGTFWGCVFALAALGTSMVHGYRVGFCDLWGGVRWYALTAGIGCVLAGAYGAIVSMPATRLARRWFVVGLALCLPIGSIALGAWRFLSSPMIYAYDPFVGYFSGTLYDTVIAPGTPLFTYRVGSACTLVALFVFASSLNVLRSSRAAALFRFGCAAAFGTASAILAWNGAELGHWSSRASIDAALGGRTQGARCTVIHPSSLRKDEADLLVKDCEENLRAVERAFQVTWEGPITAIMFRDSAEKRRLMGAEHTYIAKPWRREVYLQLSAYPHPVLGHELAHVVAGQFGVGPFHTAGRLAGFIPNPGLIEGVAVYASPDDDTLSLSELTKAMIDLGLAPPVRSIFSLEFFGESSQKSYTVAGAFVTYVAKTYGVDVVKRWYHGEDITSIANRNWAELDSDFRASFSSVTLSKEAVAAAKARFDRPSVWRRRCPHVVDGLRAEGDRCSAAHETEKALTAYESALSVDPKDTTVRVSRAELQRRYGDRARGEEELGAVSVDESLPVTVRKRADELLADAEMREGKFDAAKARYERLLQTTIDEDAARTLEVKVIAATDETARGPILSLLIGSEARGTDPMKSGLALGEAPRSALVDYLVGRNLAQKSFCDEATPRLASAIATGLPTIRLTREAWKLRATCACITGDREALAAVKARVSDPKGPWEDAPAGRRTQIERLLERCSP